jgi:PTH1 family peptidyl-tRNA hydrolase
MRGAAMIDSLRERRRIWNEESWNQYLPYSAFQIPYTISRMKPSFVFVGLGNPGKQYERTRHNTGFQAADRLAKECGAGDWHDQQKLQCVAAEATIGECPVLIVKPTTYMNRSGECIRKIIDFYKLDPSAALLVSCDDVDIPLGTTRLRMDGGPGTHNGLKSIVETIGESFPRIRVGIGPQPVGIDLAAWVLSTFPEDEQDKLNDALEDIAPTVTKLLKGVG